MPSKIAQKHAKSTIKSAPKPAQKALDSSAESKLDFMQDFNQNLNADFRQDFDNDSQKTSNEKISDEKTSSEKINAKSNEYTKNKIEKSDKNTAPNPTANLSKIQKDTAFAKAKISPKDTIKQLNKQGANSLGNIPSQTLSNQIFIHPHLATKKTFLFANRQEAFDKLYDCFINQHIDSKQNLILATSFDGLFFAHSLAHKLESKLDLLFSAPIFAPMNDECEIASVSENMDIVLNEELIDSFDITLDYVYGEARRTYEDVLLPRIYKFRKGTTLSDLSQKDIFLIDQGVQSGITMSLAIKTCIQKKAKSIFVLTPVISRDVAELLKRHCDTLISVDSVDYFVSTEHYYESLEHLSEEEVLSIMSAHTKIEKQNNAKETKKI